MKAQWNEAIGGFACHLTKVKLSDDQFNPLRASWEHLEPANEKTAVLAAAIFNHMKSDPHRERVQGCRHRTQNDPPTTPANST
jgi:hypothetical protein